MKSLSRFSILLSAVAALSFVALTPVQARKHKDEGSHHRHMKHEKAAEHHKEEKAAEHGKKCSDCAMAKKSSAHLDTVIKDLKAAQKAVKAGNSDEASKKLASAIKRLEGMQKMMGQHHTADSAKPVNTRCPIMGTKINPEKTPEKLTRKFDGKTVGFCCAGCPARWDKLSEEEKAKKLQKAMPKK